MKMDKKKYIEAKKWTKIGAKLKKKYPAYNDLRKHCIKIYGKQYFEFREIPDKDLLTIGPNHVVEGGTAGHIHSGNLPFYSIKDDGSLVKIETSKIIDELADKLAQHIDRKSLIKDVLQYQNPMQLDELYERVISIPKKTKKKPSIQQRPGCAFLSIGGKPGKPIDLFLRD